MKIAVAADHRGQEAKDKIAEILRAEGHDVLDLGTNSTRACDYPDFAYPAARAVADGHVEFAVLVCASGIGMDMCANKVPGIRAALCHDELTAAMSRRHNDANVLCLASDVLGGELIRRIVTTWLTTPFEGGPRHERRIRKIAWIEQGKDPTKFNEQNGAEP